MLKDAQQQIWEVVVTLEILMVTSEAYPLAKTGGLGDAVSGLAQAVCAENIPVTIMMPGWRNTLEKLHDVRQIAVLDDLPGGTATLVAGDSKALGLRVLLLCNDALFDRDGLYVDADGKEYADNAVRFAALSMAAAHVGRGLEAYDRPAIIHAHDWHAALTPLYLHQFGVTGVKTALTLHNVAFQGVYPKDVAPALNLKSQYTTSDALEFWGQINFLKAGIRFSDRITVVSHNYAREVLTPRYGCGLEGLLAARNDDLVAIPNGIDTRLWDPRHDPYLGHKTFSADRMENKAACKGRLQAAYGLESGKSSFLLAMGNRLTEQKMVDVAARALPEALEKYPQLQLCIMGQGERQAEIALSELAQRYPGRCGVYIGYSEARAHMLHAGADALLHGSRFEPFGLTPLYAMRYGTIPIGSRVGGMADTIIDPGHGYISPDLFKATGILFDGDSQDDMLGGIDRAISLNALPLVWRTLQRNAMTARMGWEGSAPLYVHMYQALRPDVTLGRVPERGVVSTFGLAAGRHSAVLARQVVKASREGARLPVRQLASTPIDDVVPTGTSIV